MPLLAESFSSYRRPVVRGVRGAVAAAHPLACAAGQEVLTLGGNAVDALVAAQAVLAVIMPDACGLGGDMLALVAEAGGDVHAVTGTGKAPRGMVRVATDGADSVTVPGIVGAWETLSRRWGTLPLARCLAPAERLARVGFPLSAALAIAVEAQRKRLVAGGAEGWLLLSAVRGDRIVQPEVAGLLARVGAEGASAFYTGASARAIERAIGRLGGAMDAGDLAAHETPVSVPVTVGFGEWSVSVQPPPTQGILLAMALRGRARLAATNADLGDHADIELTEAAFASRADCAAGEALLDLDLEVDLRKASRRGGPRAYLHTAGVCATDAAGMTVSSLVSVFDDFGSCVFVPELGITLNNRAGGFTGGANAAAPGKRPVHTLAPALLRGPGGTVALATPGADGQVQTLLQVIGKLSRGATLEEAIAAPRWRSEGGRVLVEEGHPAISGLAALGHDMLPLPRGDMRFGAVVAAGQADGGPFALADWRRECWSGVA